MNKDITVIYDGKELPAQVTATDNGKIKVTLTIDTERNILAEELPIIITRKAEEHKILNDKRTRRFFSPTEEEIKEGALKVDEGKTKSNQAVLTRIAFWAENNLPSPQFNKFDREVFFVCCSLQEAGNKATTTDIIFSHLTGNRKGRIQPSEEMSKKIMNSICKLITCYIWVDTKDLVVKFGYKGIGFDIAKQVLPATITRAIINGKVVKYGIVFLEKPPLMKLAEERNQIISIPTSFFDVPVSATETAIILKGTLSRRIWEIKNHGMNVVMKYSTMEETYNAMSRTEKLRFRNKVKNLLDAWKRMKFFTDYEIVKMNGAFHGVKILP